MKVIKPFEYAFVTERPLDALDLASKEVPRISIVGAGGKTTTLEALADDYRERKRLAIVTTTTHMFYPEDRWFFTTSEDVSYIQYKLKEHGIVWVGAPCDHGKITSVSEEFKQELLKCKIPILVEADGSKRLPFKIPNDREPVLFPGTTCVLALLGMDALHKQIGEVCFRGEMVARFLSKTGDDILEEDDFVKIIMSSQGSRKQVNSSMQFKVILNKVDTEETMKYALNIRNKLMEQRNEDVYITSYQ
ncbi:MAG: selenium cofactor biosynthesis protein YqeC [Velocimicrobium sp.]